MSEVELKFFDGGVSLGTVSTTGEFATPSSLVLVREGVESDERIGRRIRVKSVGLKGVATLSGSTVVSSTDDTCRLIVFIDYQANGAAPAVLDVLQNARWNSYNQLSNSERFHILHNVVWDLNAKSGGGPVGTSTSFESARSFELYSKMDLSVEFRSDGGTVADLTQANVGVLAISKSGLVALEFEWRVRFTDQ